MSLLKGQFTNGARVNIYFVDCMRGVHDNIMNYYIHYKMGVWLLKILIMTMGIFSLKVTIFFNSYEY